ncbi:hypothetical protein [Variovorax sp. YR216]|uniref:hypothetical protein n=1 Tax=Variovorax sp. YR216 TaxID=1882828 RepID=UPI0015A1C980|nr:hypothetical protein [Variovorax sp. YR216]
MAGHNVWCHRHDFEEFLVQPNELWALMEVVNAEVGRRMQMATDAIPSARQALH